MHVEKTLWILEEAIMEEQSDIMTLPEFRQRVDQEVHDDDFGVRSLFEHPEVLLDIAGWPGKERK